MTPQTQILAEDLETLPQFDGFPYLNTRVCAALYHITLLPAEAPEFTLMNLARGQMAANRLDICLVLDFARCVFFWSDGRVQTTANTPRGGTLLANRLELPIDFLPTDDLRLREADLARVVEHGRRKGAYMSGDLTKGGRNATPEELQRLEGTNRQRAPRGLTQCMTCRDWRGECLDPSPQFAGMVMPVHCRCENHNRCARCGVPLHEARLNANYYNPQDRSIWHVPGFCGLSHKCRAAVGREGLIKDVGPIAG
ncbi:MAG: hypothetical protein ABIP65_01670 [Vicinamibacterales bacterium]